MELKPSLAARPQLSLSPRLYQSLKILRLTAADLQQLIQEELNENPVLEMPEPSDFGSREDSHSERELWHDFLASRSRDAAARGDGSAPLNPPELAASPVTLADHLTLQLDLEELDGPRRHAGLAIIGSLDDDGYLRDNTLEIAAATGVARADIEAALVTVQRFDPPGVAARSLEECLLLQLGQIGGNRLAGQIIRSHLPRVARGAFAEIAREIAAPVARVRQAVALIRSLNPSPGSLFDTGPPAGAIVPDVFVDISQGQVQVIPNRELLPPLRLSRLYRDMAADGDSLDRDTRKFVKSKLREATCLIRDIEQRRATVTDVARAIAEAQREFFRQGPGSLKPLSLDDVAGALKVHPSTISRAVLGKYMSTPYGVFELRYFFAAGYAAADGKHLAATAIKKRLSRLIAGEDPRRPLSDRKLADLLKVEKIDISRRTVAKYREAAGTPPSWMRKQRD